MASLFSLGRSKYFLGQLAVVLGRGTIRSRVQDGAALHGSIREACRLADHGLIDSFAVSTTHSGHDLATLRGAAVKHGQQHLSLERRVQAAPGYGVDGAPDLLEAFERQPLALQWNQSGVGGEDALCCASKSTSNTRCSASARAQARLTAVVVLPTPPFWLMTAIIMGMPVVWQRSFSAVVAAYYKYL